MKKNNIYIGKSELNTQKQGVNGQFVELDGQKYYRIQNYHEMPDFFMSIVSDSDHWMFISSNGALTAGRKDRNNALFPYYTDDKIHDYKGITGSRSYFLVEKSDKKHLWSPFTDESAKFYQITRNLYKSIYGNSLVFEEVNHDLNLCFRYGWHNSEQFGFVKKSVLQNLSATKIKVEVLDGIRNILPYGIDYGFQNEYSNLLDAYKKNELVKGTTLGLFMLSSIPVDRAEPSEALKTTAVWSLGPDESSAILISDKQVNLFKKGEEVLPEYDIKASRGAYYVHTSLMLDAKAENHWYTVAEIHLGTTEVANLKHDLLHTDNMESQLLADIEKGTTNLINMVSNSDGFQVTNTTLCTARHYSNTLYNIMRGGVFAKNYEVETQDYARYLKQINQTIAEKYAGWVSELPAQISYPELLEKTKDTRNPELLRITYEYLPLTFSRRHGDPSRPWNQFSIETKNEDGSLKYNYQGNWRDIFQNWEALCYSYPEFVEGIILKFVNASTIDGYNPYRIMRDGIDWEAPDPHDPWSYIGYWGDHQIIYLQKLLELSHQFHPGKIDELLTKNLFTYANVPYRIVTYADIVKNPKDTVHFDEALHHRIASEVTQLGADARLLKDQDGKEIYKVNLTEKILTTLLSKMSNFVPEAGIWLNTQRPEWNDANNALVGNGTSVVTLYYLRRFLKFWEERFSQSAHDQLTVSEEMADLFYEIQSIYNNGSKLLIEGFTDQYRKTVTDALGRAHEKYRTNIYHNSFSGDTASIQLSELISFCQVALKYVDQTIRKNKRDDGLYHAYNLISFQENGIAIRHLYEMLEGQVAILSAGILTPEESLEVLDALKKSKIFREDQYSYMLYPNRELPRFEDKNNIPGDLVVRSALFARLMKDGNREIIKVDREGGVHFNGTFRNASALNEALNQLEKDKYGSLVQNERTQILDTYEKIFDHQSFTGRSGTFYGYEGLGSIYWHMVSKLLLATQESYLRALDQGADVALLGRMKEHYYEIKAGIGLYKSPELYGAFPTDAYSHTPFGAGVKQPGLTGQVKEDIISRWGEMGVRIIGGEIIFEPSLLNKEEILTRPRTFAYQSVDGNKQTLELAENQLAFTFCQVPVVYSFADMQQIAITYSNGLVDIYDGNTLYEDFSQQIFERNGQIKLIEVMTNKNKNVL